MNALTCRNCGSSFPDHRPPGTRGRKPGYCSPECRQATRRDYNTGRTSERRLQGKCIDCPQTDVRDVLPGTDFCPEHTGRRAAVALKHSLARYGLTPEALAALYSQQDARCGICKRTEAETGGRRFAIDHAHSCCPGDGSCGSCVRGLLCSGCNTGIGLLGDSLERLQEAASYLSRPREPGPDTPEDPPSRKS